MIETKPHKKLYKKMDLFAWTKKRLQDYKGNWPFIAVKAEVPKEWIIYLMKESGSNNVKNPHVKAFFRVMNVLIDLENGDLLIPLGGRRKKEKLPKRIQKFYN